MKRLALLLALAGCATKQEPTLQKPLFKAILVPRKDHKFLTSSNCEEYDNSPFNSKPKCKKLVITEYDLADAGIREQMRSLRYICKVGGRQRFLICKDKPGLCHLTYNRKKFIGIPIKKTPVPTYIDQSEMQKLYNAKTKCFSRNVYAWEQM